MAGYGDPESGYTQNAPGFFALLSHLTDITNKFDKDLTPATGDTLAWNGSVYAPVASVANVKSSAYAGGAIGNGIADDTAAIHAARDASGVKTLYFPPGTYRTLGGVTASVAGQNWHLAAGATLVVEFSGTPSATGTAAAITVSADAVTIDGPGKIDAPNTWGFANPISDVFIAAGADDTIVRNVELSGGTYGVRVKAATGTVCKRTQVKGCTVHGQGINGVFVHFEAEDTEVSGNQFYSTGAGAIYVGVGAIRSRVIGNSVTSSGSIGIEVNSNYPTSGSSDTIVANNTVDTCASTGISVDHCRGVIIIANRVTNIATDGIGGHGIELARGVKCIVSNNYIETVALHGIYLPTASTGTNDDNVIIGNLVISAAQRGIADGGTLGSAYRTKIIGNTIINPGTGAIRSSATISKDWIISGNIIQFDTTGLAGIECQAPGSVISNNVITYSSAIASAAGNAIDVQASGLNVSVTGNVVNGNGKCAQGVRIDSAVTGVLVQGNRISGTATNVLNNASSSTTNQISNNSGTASAGGVFSLSSAVGVGNKDTATAIAFYTGSQRFDNNIGFYGTTPIAKPTVTGSRGGNAALASLLTQLAALGLITDSSTA